MSYTINDIKVAAYNWNELPNMTPEERSLWESLGFWYEHFRAHPEDKEECEKAANGYIEHFLNLQIRRYG